MNAILKRTEQNEPNIPALCAAWLNAKAQENDAKDARQAIEAALVDAMKFSKPEGSQTMHAEGFKVEFKSAMNYRLDTAKWEEIAANIPDGLRPVKVKLEVDERGARYLRDNEPELWKLAAQAITVSPPKVGVKVSREEG